MPNEPTLLSYLGKGQPEKCALIVLFYILSNSESAREALRQMLIDRIHVDIGTDLDYVMQQANEDGGIPDLGAQDANQTTRLLVELKFGAPLTDAQPVGYLKNLPAGGVLIFVTTIDQQRPTWRNLRGRVLAEGWQVEDKSDESGFHTVAIIDGKYLAVSNWKNIISYLERAAKSNGEAQVLIYLKELRSLCEQQESEYIPLTKQELTGTWWKKLVQLGQLLKLIAWSLYDAGVLTTKPVPGGHGGYTVNIKGRSCLLHVDPVKWTELGAPVWISIGGFGILPTYHAIKAAGFTSYTSGNVVLVALPVEADKDMGELHAKCNDFLLSLVKALPPAA